MTSPIFVEKISFISIFQNIKKRKNFLKHFVIIKFFEDTMILLMFIIETFLN
nr:MAG TPA: hypothetical protein [Caudoviricetes sp.]